MTKTAKIALFGLLFYIIFMLAVLLVKFLKTI